VATIQISSACKIFSDPKRNADVVALDNINLSVERNRFLCLLGPSVAASRHCSI
jgi:NitT/TauT family transport system ATP-binding protein